MKTYFQNLLIIAGIYSILIEILDRIPTGLLCSFIILLIALFFKKVSEFIKSQCDKMPIICNYLRAFGITTLLTLCLLLLTWPTFYILETYFTYTGMETLSIEIIIIYVIWKPAFYIILAISLLQATYKSFIKPRLKK